MKKIASVLLAAALGAGSIAVAGCSKEDPASTLYINISNAGYGVAWLDPLIDIFEKEHPGIKVDFDSLTKGDSIYTSKLLSGTKDVDLYFVETEVHHLVDTPVVFDGVRYDSAFEDLTDLYDEKIPGEEKTMREKMDKTYMEYHTVKGKQYTMPWIVSTWGLIMNNKVRQDSFGKFPNTTEELYEYCENIKSKGVTPFIFALNDSYWDGIYELWTAQYNGREKTKKFFEGYSVYGETEGERYVPQMLLNEGLRESLGVLETLLKKENGFQSELSYTFGFTEVQNKFLEGKDNILMCPNGGWIQREMEYNYDSDELDIQFVRMPVISALGTKLGITDDVLSAIVDYADGTTAEVPEFTSTKGIERQKVIDEVVEARSYIALNYNHSAIVPSYSPKKELAKEFLQLMASDRGMEEMVRVCGSRPPFEFDIEKTDLPGTVSNFVLTMQQLIRDSSFCFYRKDKLFTLGGLKIVNGISGTISQKFAANNPDDFVSAEKLYMDSYGYARNNWNNYLIQAGIEV